MNLTPEFGKALDQIIEHKRKLRRMREDCQAMETQLDELHAWLLGLHPGNPVSPLAARRISGRVIKGEMERS